MADCFKFSSPVKSPLGDLGVKQQQSGTAPKFRIAQLGVKPRSGLSRIRSQHEEPNPHFEGGPGRCF